jgi:hypothetical protein
MWSKRSQASGRVGQRPILPDRELTFAGSRGIPGAAKGDNVWGLARATLEVDGKRVVLTQEGMEHARERAAEKRREVAERAAVDRANEGG